MRSVEAIRADVAVTDVSESWSETYHAAIVRLLHDVEPLLDEVERLEGDVNDERLSRMKCHAEHERRFAEREKANVASRRSICELSDKYKAERDVALGALAEALPVVEYVSCGRGYVGVEPYPDATARVANASIRDALELAALPLNTET